MLLTFLSIYVDGCDSVDPVITTQFYVFGFMPLITNWTYLTPYGATSHCCYSSPNNHYFRAVTPPRGIPRYYLNLRFTTMVSYSTPSAPSSGWVSPTYSNRAPVCSLGGDAESYTVLLAGWRSTTCFTMSCDTAEHHTLYLLHSIELYKQISKLVLHTGNHGDIYPHSCILQFCLVVTIHLCYLPFSSPGY